MGITVAIAGRLMLDLQAIKDGHDASGRIQTSASDDEHTDTHTWEP